MKTISGIEIDFDVLRGFFRGAERLSADRANALFCCLRAPLSYAARNALIDMGYADLANEPEALKKFLTEDEKKEGVRRSVQNNKEGLGGEALGRGEPRNTQKTQKSGQNDFGQNNGLTEGNEGSEGEDGAGREERDKLEQRLIAEAHHLKSIGKCSIGQIRPQSRAMIAELLADALVEWMPDWEEEDQNNFGQNDGGAE